MMTKPDFSATGASPRVTEVSDAAMQVMDSINTLTMNLALDRENLPAGVADDDPRVLALNEEFAMVEVMIRHMTKSLSIFHTTIATSHSRWLER